MPSTHCPHSVLYYDTSDGARAHTEWTRPDETERLAAGTVDGSAPGLQSHDAPQPTAFPGPLVMPDDVLALDPDEEPQPLHEYVQEPNRNPLSKKRNVIYVFDAPSVSPQLAQARRWQDPVIPEGPGNEPPPGSTAVSQPAVEDIAAYIKAFYHGIDVCVVKGHFCLVPWTVPKRRGKADTAQYIGLSAAGAASSDHNEAQTVTRIRHRSSSDGVAPQGQLNLNDLLDGLTQALPSDAYSAMLLMHHDLYEDDDDDFCCGRAYGKSRICVASTFRDHPKLGPHEGIALEHTWPNAHCRKYVDAVWQCMLEDDEDAGEKTKAKDGQRFKPDRMAKLPPPVSSARGAGSRGTLEPLAAAVLSTKSLTSKKRLAREEWEMVWLSRICVVAVHELGHCFGLDHCVYYACVMQGTASVVEGAQQPPYLCPVCQAKVAFTLVVEPASAAGGRRRAVAGISEAERMRLQREWIKGQYAALGGFCEGRDGGMMFRALGAWLRARTEQDLQSGQAVSNEQTQVTSTSASSRSADYFSGLVD